MIGRDEITAALGDHMAAVAVAQSLGSRDLVRSSGRAVGVDDDALLKVATVFAEFPAPDEWSPEEASTDGFFQGVLVGVRLALRGRGS